MALMAFHLEGSNMGTLNPIAGMDYLRTQGWSDNQAAGIMGNLYGESGWNSRAVGDGGLAVGIAQWHPDRQATFRRVIGVPVMQATPMQQLQFVNWELNNTESRAGRLLRGQTTVEGATRVFMEKYERPANLSSLGKRIASAKSLLQGGKDLASGAVKGAKSILGIDTEDAIVAASNAIIPGSGAVLSAFGLGGDDCNWICEIKNWIADSGFFQRIALAILAFIVIVAAFYLIKPSVVNNAMSKL